MKKIKHGILSGNQLKIIAVIAMTCDHAGKQFFSDISFLQIFGRLAFPIFAYMIAEGCRYTKNRKKYLLNMAVLALVCQIVYFFTIHSLYQCVIVTFSLSIALIWVMDNARQKKTLKSIVLVFTVFAGICILTDILPCVLTNTDFYIDYGLWGVMLPVLVFAVDEKWEKLILTTAVLVLIALPGGGIQWYSIAAVPLLALYNGERGTLRMKNLFYTYYPLHLAVIYGISMIGR